MKTIEVNLIGDLKQKTTSKKLGPLPAAVTDDAKPGDNRNNLILYGLSGTGIIGTILFVVIFVILFGFGIFLDSQIGSVDEKISDKSAELSKFSKKQSDLLNQKKDLIVKAGLKLSFTAQKFPMGDVLEELRAKIPTDIYLTEVRKAKSGFLLKGNVSNNSKAPLKSITRFIINLNTMMPEDSIIKNAFLATVGFKERSYTFAIKADLKGFEDPKKKKL